MGARCQDLGLSTTANTEPKQGIEASEQYSLSTGTMSTSLGNQCGMKTREPCPESFVLYKIPKTFS